MDADYNTGRITRRGEGVYALSAKHPCDVVPVLAHTVPDRSGYAALVLYGIHYSALA